MTRSRGVRQFSAHVLTENRPAVSLLAGYKWTAIRARYSDHRGAACRSAVLIQITDVVIA
jgi:hypothetical protein